MRSLQGKKKVGAFFLPGSLTETDLCPSLANHAGGYAHSYMRGGRRTPPPHRIPPHTLSAAEEASQVSTFNSYYHEDGPFRGNIHLN